MMQLEQAARAQALKQRRVERFQQRDLAKVGIRNRRERAGLRAAAGINMEETASRREAAVRILLVPGKGNVDRAVPLCAELIQPTGERFPLRVAGGE